MNEKEFNYKTKSHVEEYLRLKHPEISPDAYSIHAMYSCENLSAIEASGLCGIWLTIFIGKEVIFSCKDCTIKQLFEKLYLELPLTK